MGRKRHSVEEIVNKLRQADVELAKGQTVAGVCKLLAVSEQTVSALASTKSSFALLFSLASPLAAFKGHAIAPAAFRRFHSPTSSTARLTASRSSLPTYQHFGCGLPFRPSW